MMKTRIIIAFVALIMAGGLASAQTSMKGRIYHNPNIMASVLNQNEEINKEIANARKQAIENAEKKKGRKLTQKEMAEIDKKVEEIKKQASAAKRAMTVAMTIEFTSANELVAKQKTKIDDDALKEMGVSWLKRKAMKAALAIAPESQKSNYEVKGNKIIIIDGKDRDTLTVSTDGNTLTGYYDKDTKFMLKRTK